MNVWRAAGHGVDAVGQVNYLGVTLVEDGDVLLDQGHGGGAGEAEEQDDGGKCLHVEAWGIGCAWTMAVRCRGRSLLAGLKEAQLCAGLPSLYIR